MERHGSVLVFLAAGLAAVMACQAQSTAPSEGRLWQIWENSTNAVDDHAAVAAACREFRVKSPKDPLVIVVAGLEAWRLLEMGNTNEAVALFEPMMSVPESATHLQTAGAEMARTWLTRLDREKVRMALKSVFVKDIEFPASLEAIKSLKINPMPPFNDRWGRPWSYRRESSIRGLNAQQYVLESTQLGPGSDLAKALALPYAGGIALSPVRRLPASTVTVEFATLAGKSALLQEGGIQNGITVAYLGANLMVMTDGNHWRVVLNPW